MSVTCKVSTPHAKSIEEVVKELKVDVVKGLSNKDVEERLSACGYNVIEAGRRKGFIQIFIEQYKNLFIVLLLAATVISAVLGEITDALLILVIVLFMTILGAIQEYRAEKTLEALRRLASPKARVIREGKVITIDASNLVPGDIILLSEGDRVPADARLIEAKDLYIDESMLTGESVPVAKRADIILPKKTIVSDQINMVFMGTYVIRGSARAIVTATGRNSYLGQIARMVEEAEEAKTPFIEEMDKLAKKISIIIVAIAILTFLTGFVLHEASIIELLLSSIALAVAAVPEGLPAIVVIVLSIAAWRMAQRNALVRKLAAVESLGAATVIATDKTGTLTLNEMTVKKLALGLGGRILDVGGEGYRLEGGVSYEGRPIKAREGTPLWLIGVNAILNNTLTYTIEGNELKFQGDPLEAALVVLAYKLGLKPQDINSRFVKLREIAFSSARKRMTVIVEDKLRGTKLILVKGAPEILLERSAYVVDEDGGIRNLTPEDKMRLLKRIEEIASQGYRLIAFAYREASIEDLKASEDLVENNLVYLGTAALIDPPRPEVPKAVERALSAGIKVIMITGDHPATAKAIAKMIGIPANTVLTGQDLESMSDEELIRIVDKVDIYARVTPEHKARIVKLLRAKGHIVAVTGDGVNDAPALKIADIGVAMGRRGTDVAKEASDIILLDDNFASIVAAVEEGRKAFDNIKRTTLYLLSANTAEVMTVFYASISGIGLLLTAPMLLWINIVTDGFPAAGLGFEEAEPDVMSRPPRGRKTSILGRNQLTYLLLIGSIFTVATMLAASHYLINNGLNAARTAAFTTLMGLELGLSLSLRRLNISVRNIKLTSNKAWLLGYLVSIILSIIASGPLAALMKGEPLPLMDAVSLLALGHIVAIVVDELRKKLGIRI